MGSEAGRLSDDELAQLARLLQRYCEFDLDQFEHWAVGTTYGDVFIELTRKRPPDALLENYLRPRFE